MNPFKVHRNWTITYQYGLDGIKRQFNLSNVVLFVVILLFFCLFFISSLYFLSMRNLHQTHNSLAKVQHENVLLRKKLDYYAGVVDSIYQKLDAISKPSSSATDRYYPYYRNDKADKIEDNTFVYDSYLDARVNSIEQRLKQITSGMNACSHPDGSVATVAYSGVQHIDNGPSIFPTFGRWSDGWGTRIHPIYNKLCFHYGVDISNKMGTPIYATSDGVVLETTWDNEYGKYIKIQHANNFETRYGHLYNFQVAKGDHVRKGQIIALMGNTGMSTGPHVHYEVLINGVKVNPAYYLNRTDDAIYYAKN